MPPTEQTPNIPSLRVAGFEALRGGWFWAPDDSQRIMTELSVQIGSSILIRMNGL
jgi:hypothetical protein